MKNIIITFVLMLLLPLYVEARMNPYIAGSNYGAAAPPATYCAACPDTTNGGDQICEIPDGSADGLCGWTVMEATGATGEVDLAAACDNSPALGCASIAMDYCASVVKTNTTSGDALAYIATSDTTHYIQFYVKILAEGITGGDVGLFLIAASTEYASVGVGFQDLGAGYHFLFYYHQAAGWTEDPSSQVIELDHWYGIRIYLVDGGAGADAGQWWVDYTPNGTWTDEGAFSGKTLDRAIAQYQIGNKATSTTISFLITGLKIDNDTMPDSCAR